MTQRCFVIQPFDNDGPFDARFDDVFVPAAGNAGLEAYRVDRDPSVAIPIDDIESGIDNARACLADITTDNPNVWFELGYAFARRKGVCLVCSEERKTPFPFDVQHRNIHKYRVGSPSYFDDLRNTISERLKAIIDSETDMDRMASLSPVSSTEGLAPYEIAVLVSILNHGQLYDIVTGTAAIQQNLERAGFNETATAIALEELKRKRMIIPDLVPSENQYESDYPGYRLTSDGLDWVLQNRSALNLTARAKPRTGYESPPPPTDNDIPF